MRIRIWGAAVAAAALGMALTPPTALAHSGGHPFENCPAAYEAGYSNIPKGDKHYGKHLDRDGDGVGCDQPPSDFVPVDDREKGDKGSGGSGTDKPAEGDGGELAETGGDSTTPYLAAGGGLALVAGATALAVSHRRRQRS